jgi:hypothetical protein
MFVVDLVGSPYPACIPVICIPEYFDALMNKDIVDEKVGCAIGHDAKTDGITIPEGPVSAPNYEGHAQNGVKYKECVISLKPGIVVFSVVVLVEAPQKTVHHVFMGKPGHEFHDGKCS